MKNRLATSTSPYLLQHAHQPVHWWEWSDEAFDEARRRDVPVFLSLGYAACHWCHVMAHESFDDSVLADYLNENFVSIKIDREERPDLDNVYMQATIALTGQGGWPMSVFVNHERQPFHAGTYFPPAPRLGMPSFREVLEAVSKTWVERRADVDEHAQALSRAISERAAFATPEPALRKDWIQQAIVESEKSWDRVNGGFGAAPKFQPSSLLKFLLLASSRDDSQLAREIAVSTLTAMARGGIYDQAGGGFARYTVDERWEIPHFEKMLYDNAQLLEVYSLWLQTARDEQEAALARRIVRGTADFIVRELQIPEGPFASSLDADSEGEEGKFYVWTKAEIAHLLPPDDVEDFCDLAGVTEGGNFEHGTSTLRYLGDTKTQMFFETCCKKLEAGRRSRIKPERDNKIIAAWNGMAISGLVRAAIALDDETYANVAADAADYLWRHHFRDGILYRSTLDFMRAQAHGILDDYAALAQGLLHLYYATGWNEFYRQARELVDAALVLFDAPDGGLFETDGESTPGVRLKQPHDGSEPSGWFVMADVLQQLYVLDGKEADARKSEQLLSIVGALGSVSPRAVGAGLTSLLRYSSSHRAIVVAGADTSEKWELARTIHSADVFFGMTAWSNQAETQPLLVRGRNSALNQTTFYFCENFVCSMPSHDIQNILERLR